LKRWCSDPRGLLALMVAALAVLELGIFGAFVALARTAGHGWRSTLVIAFGSTWVISRLMRNPPRCPGCRR
jgi:hypothetical protein